MWALACETRQGPEAFLACAGRKCSLVRVYELLNTHKLSDIACCTLTLEVAVAGAQEQATKSLAGLIG